MTKKVAHSYIKVKKILLGVSTHVPAFPLGPGSKPTSGSLVLAGGYGRAEFLLFKAGRSLLPLALLGK